MAKDKLGKCYELSFKFITENEHLEKAGLHIRLIHGTIYSKSLKKRIDHAWIEMGNVVIDSSVNSYARKEEYYAFHEAKAMARYTKKEAFKIGLEAGGNYGPWT